ncbi:MAG: rhodanese-like domain-containing protein [Gammaproteobacteria bacterium]|nr:MAG: rhodanese-like domain-containing protein [Gammaproteobacteria bacterium]
MDIYFEFAANHGLLVAGLIFSFFLLLFTELRRKAQGLTNIEPTEAVQLINADAAVIDVRSPEAFARGHIVNARNIPIDELDASHAKLEQLKSQPILAVCDAGVTSTRAVNALRKSGLERVYGLKGGLNAWSQASLPLVTARKTGKNS